MSKGIIILPLLVILASCNGSPNRDLAACKLAAFHEKPGILQATHVTLCMEARGWRFTADSPGCGEDIEDHLRDHLRSDCYDADSWPFRRKAKRAPQ